MTDTEWIFLGIGIGLLIIIILATVIAIKHYSRKNKIKKVSELGNLILKAIGKENITSLKLNRQRLTINIIDADFIDKELLKKANLRAVVSKKEVKFLIKESEKQLYTFLRKERKGD
ncbi:MAG: hypothetical protein GX794_03120 [Acholeplasmataceae bacterium]|nr:hypothetical protein [Acholeplasmataceae bacterium]